MDYKKDNPSNPITVGDFPSDPLTVYYAPDKIISTPITSNDTIYLRTKEYICAVEAIHFTQIWCRLSPGVLPFSLPPQLKKDILVTSERNSYIATYSAKTGDFLWRSKHYRDHIENPKLSDISSFVTNDSSVFVARGNHKIISYDLESGETNWSDYVPGRTALYLAANNQVVILAAGEELRAYDAKSGTMIWEKESEGLFKTVLLDQDTLYVSHSFGDERLFALDLSSAGTKWVISFDELDGDKIRRLSIESDILQISGEKYHRALKLSGELLCSSEELGYLEPAVVLNKQVFVRNTDTSLYNIDPELCLKMGRMTVQANTLRSTKYERSPAVLNNFILVPFGDNRLFIYQPGN